MGHTNWVCNRYNLMYVVLLPEKTAHGSVLESHSQFVSHWQILNCLAFLNEVLLALHFLDDGSHFHDILVSCPPANSSSLACTLLGGAPPPMLCYLQPWEANLSTTFRAWVHAPSALYCLSFIDISIFNKTTLCSYCCWPSNLVPPSTYSSLIPCGLVP